MSHDKPSESEEPLTDGQFFLPAQSFEHCYEIKKSEFICQLHEVVDRPAAMAALSQAREQYPDARHHCWAYILGEVVSQAFNDDGEPSGTAGKPILNVLQHRGMGNTMAIVVRYFGGIKLGAGGLVRAYSQATQQAIELCPLARFVPKQLASLDCPYDLEPTLRRFLGQHNGSVIEQKYDSSAKFKISLPKPEVPIFKTWLSHHFQIICDFKD